MSRLESKLESMLRTLFYLSILTTLLAVIKDISSSEFEKIDNDINEIKDLFKTEQVHTVSLYNANNDEITGKDPTHVIFYDSEDNAFDTVAIIQSQFEPGN